MFARRNPSCTILKGMPAAVCCSAEIIAVHTVVVVVVVASQISKSYGDDANV